MSLYLKNPNLNTILPDWPGNPFEKGRFQYTYKPFVLNNKNIWKWQLSKKPQKAAKKADTWRVPVVTDVSWLDTTRDFIVWLGHASFLIQVNGVRLLTDPVWYNIAVMPRLAPMPFDLEVFKRLDYVFISHDHRDHCDRKTLKKLAKISNFKVLTALKVGQVVQKWLPQTPIQEAGWFQVFDTDTTKIKLTFLPSQHWGRRWLHDFNHRLWGSLMIEWPSTEGVKRFYFGGDSAQGPHFDHIAALFPNIEYAALGIGAYAPDYVMQGVHTNPEEAFAAFKTLHAQYMIPMHYGTYDLSDEPISEPLTRLKTAAADTDALKILPIGKPLFI